MSFDTAVTLATEGLIKPFEGCHRMLSADLCQAYPDPGTHAEPWTIWWGSTHGVEKDAVWDRARGEDALTREVLACAMNLLKQSPGLSQATDARFAALISFVYNCGIGNYRISTLKRRVNEGDWVEAAREILKWNKAAGRVMPGLTRRRAAEAALLR